MGYEEIYDTNEGAQFTSHDFIDALKAHPLRISMEGRGRAADNILVERLWRTVKYEDIYLQDYETLSAGGRQVGLKVYFPFYNGARGHQSLGYQTPDVVYATGQGGSAELVRNLVVLRSQRRHRDRQTNWPAKVPRSRSSAVPRGLNLNSDRFCLDNGVHLNTSSIIFDIGAASNVRDAVSKSVDPFVAISKKNDSMTATSS